MLSFSLAESLYASERTVNVANATITSGRMTQPCLVNHLHPLQLLIIVYVLSILNISFTRPCSPIRLLTFAFLVFLIFSSIPGAFQIVSFPALRNIYAAELVTRVIHFLDVAIISKWCYECAGPARPNPHVQYAAKRAATTVTRRNSGGSFLGRLRFGAEVALSHRYCGTDIETKNVPHFKRSQPNFTPTRTRFLYRTIARGCVCYILMDLISSGQQLDAKQIFGPDRVPLLWRDDTLSIQDIRLRLAVSIGTLVGIYLTVNWMRSSIALVVVCSRLGKPQNWRPMWGGMRDAYSIRNFWGKFWQQTNRQRFTSAATWLTYDVLRFRKGGVVGRYLSMFITFYLSGWVHAGAEIASGRPIADSHAVRYFVTQYCGILMEDLGYEILTQLGFSAWGRLRLLGYVWVILFQTWSVPAWIYPELETKTGSAQEAILPFSAIGWIRLKKI